MVNSPLIGVGSMIAHSLHPLRGLVKTVLLKHRRESYGYATFV